MTKLLISIALLILVSCGDEKPYDSDFTKYIEEFESLYGVEIDYPVVFDSTIETSIAGKCVRYKENHIDRNIYINIARWDSYSDAQRELLLFHELSHCSLDIFEHSDSYFIDDKCPVSIMRSYMFSEEEVEKCYISNRLYYLDELSINRKDL